MSASTNDKVDIGFVRKDYNPKSVIVEFVAFVKEENTVNLFNTNQAFRLVLIKEASNIAEANYIGKSKEYDHIIALIRELKTIESLYTVKQTFERERDTVDGYEKV